MDRSSPGSLAAGQRILEAFLSVPLNGIDPDTDDGVQRMLASGRQYGVDERSLDKGVTFNSGI